MSASVPLSLAVMETFHSLQGEGLHAGRSAFFIRLAGCNVGCPWCDTRHSWEAEDHPRRPLADLAQELAEAAAAGAAFAVLTGGEPLEHDLEALCAALAAAVPSLPLHLETSGAAPLRLSGRFAWITLSPKRHRPPSAELLAACDELKVVVHEPADLVFAEAMAQQALAARASLAAGSVPSPTGADEPRAPAVGRGLDPGTITAQADAAHAAVVCPDRANDHRPEVVSRAVAACPPVIRLDRAQDPLASADGCGLNPGEATAPSVAPQTPVARQDPANDQLPEVAGGGPESGVPQLPSTRPGPALLLQPGWNCRRGQELAVDFVRQNPAWRLSLQSHKWLGVR